MTPLEEAEVARTLISDYRYTQGRVADAIGRTQSLISKWMSVFRLDRRVVKALRDGAIGMKTALAPHAWCGCAHEASEAEPGERGSAAVAHAHEDE